MADRLWQVTLTITDPAKPIIDVLAKYLRDEWLGPGKPDVTGGDITVRVEVKPVDGGHAGT